MRALLLLSPISASALFLCKRLRFSRSIEFSLFRSVAIKFVMMHELQDRKVKATIEKTHLEFSLKSELHK